jgi:hypothetical protein
VSESIQEPIWLLQEPGESALLDCHWAPLVTAAAGHRPDWTHAGP